MLQQMMREYIDLVDRMRRDRLHPDELQQLDSERQVLHTQILEMIGKTRGDIDDMYQHCKRELRRWI